jgi:phage regulator Rha-like protein
MRRPIAFLAKRVESRILLIRGHRVILDTDLAELYGVEVKKLNQQVKRNARRFPDDFVVQLSAEEAANLRSQIVTSSSGHGGRRYLPHAFTEHGAIMVASVLNSEHAVEMSIFVVRAFVRMREALAANQQIMAQLAELERRGRKPRREYPGNRRSHPRVNGATSSIPPPHRFHASSELRQELVQVTLSFDQLWQSFILLQPQQQTLKLGHGFCRAMGFDE